MTTGATSPPPDYRGLLHFAGFRYWTASLLPALVGTTLPFWLRSRHFTFKAPEALLFLLATVLFHAGFSLLQSGFQGRGTPRWSRPRLLGSGGACVAAGCLLGLLLNAGLTLHRGVHPAIFIIYGVSTVFVALLYVAPPFNFCRHPGGEIVLWESLGMIPVLGAYLVQVGDLTRTVYLASLPLVLATALWIWTDQLVTREEDEREGRRTLVSLFGARASGQWLAAGITVACYATIIGAVLVSALSPWALVAVPSVGLAGKIIAVSWRRYADPAAMLEARRKALVLYRLTGVILVASSLVAGWSGVGAR